MKSKRRMPLRYLIFDQKTAISKRSIIQRISQPVKSEQESHLGFAFNNLQIQVNPEKREPESTASQRRLSRVRGRVSPFDVDFKLKDLPLQRSSFPNTTFSISSRQRRRGLSAKASTLVHLMK